MVFSICWHIDFKASAFFLFLFFWRSAVTSSFLFKSKDSSRCDTTLVLKKWLCTHLRRADIKLVNALTPVLWLAASAMIVSSSVKSISVFEEFFNVLLIPNHPFLNSAARLGCLINFQQVIVQTYVPSSIIWLVESKK